jgi:hypothetical protein
LWFVKPVYAGATALHFNAFGEGGTFLFFNARVIAPLVVMLLYIF